MPKIIVMTGYMGSGKDTATMLIHKLTPAVRVAFADPIKEISTILFGWDGEHHHGYLKEREDFKTGITPRKFYQKFGDYGRHTIPNLFPEFKKRVGVNLWADLAIRKINELPEDSLVVISDARYPSEVMRLKQYYGPDSVEVIQIMRPQAILPWWKKLFQHSSERMIAKLPIDHVIVNDGSVDDLEMKLKIMLKMLGVIE